MSSTAAVLSPPPLGVGSKFVGYEIRGLIGQGGHACVFHGFDAFMGQHVAIKVLHRPGGVTPEMLQRGQAEAQLLHRLRHPNIVEVSRAGIEGGLMFIVMELLRGRSLGAVLETYGRLCVEEVLLLGAQIADAAAAAHDHKAIHRDLKPDNVFVTPGNHVKVLDFGVAKLMDQGGFKTQQDIVVGTMLYMSPEQLQGMPLTPQSDIYALGLILYTALLGIHPCLVGVHDPTFEELARIQVMRNPPALDELDPAIPAYVARLIGRMLSKFQEERPASMRQLAVDLRATLSRYADEQRRQQRVLQARDLSQGGVPASHAAPGAVNVATRTDDGFVAFSAGAVGAKLGPAGTAPLARIPVTPAAAPPTRAFPTTAPPVERSVPGRPSDSAASLARASSNGKAPPGVLRRASSLRAVVVLAGAAAVLCLIGLARLVWTSGPSAVPSAPMTTVQSSQRPEPVVGASTGPVAPAKESPASAFAAPSTSHSPASPASAIAAASTAPPSGASPKLQPRKPRATAAPAASASSARGSLPDVASGLDTPSPVGQSAPRSAAPRPKAKPIEIESGLVF